MSDIHCVFLVWTLYEYLWLTDLVLGHLSFLVFKLKILPFNNWEWFICITLECPLQVTVGIIHN